MEAAMKKTQKLHPLTAPFTRAQISALRVGDRVRLSGRIFTGRDRFHKYLCEGGKPPVSLRDAAIYHCGPVVVRKAGRWVVTAAGPTTSIREESYTPAIMARHGLRVMIGKGGMGAGTRAACRRHGGVYIQVIGGAAALLAAKIRRVEAVYFLQEFGQAEAVWVFDVDGLEGVVTMDATGGDEHAAVKDRSRRVLKKLLK